MPLPIHPDAPERHHGDGPPYGWSVRVRRHPSAGAPAEDERRRKGSRAAALRAAGLVPHAECVVALESYDREAWVRTFGEGRQ